MSEAKILTESDLERVEARLKDCARTGRAYATSWGEIKSFLLTIRSLQEWQSDVQEREAAVCPEDVPFDEYIRALETKPDTNALPDCSNRAGMCSEWTGRVD